MTEPRWICADCGKKYGTPHTGVATYHEGKCPVCGEIKSITSGRKYRPYKKEKPGK